MINKNFKLAFVNSIHTGPYDPPRLNPASGGTEWLIVTRFGNAGEFLEIADTTMLSDSGERVRGSAEAVPENAPESLEPLHSMLGLLLRKQADGGLIYQLVRRNLDKLPLNGQFYPVDGYASLFLSDGRLCLSASGRHAHDKNGGDIPNPAAGEGMSWHFDACAVRWVGES